MVKRSFKSRRNTLVNMNHFRSNADFSRALKFGLNRGWKWPTFPLLI
jgi:hypothetical protein